MVKNNSYIVIQSWMVNKYELKGNALLIYAIIYGFCQDGHSCFHGSLQYLQDWTNSTRQGVINTLNDLIDKKLIRKEKSFPNNKYYLFDEIENDLTNDEEVTEDIDSKVNLQDSKKTLHECKESLQDSKETLHNNINNNINNIKNNNINICPNNTDKDFNKKEKNIYEKTKSSIRKNAFEERAELESKVEDVMSYFNKVCKTNFKSTTAATVKYIKARLKEGFTTDDMKIVIDHMYNQWGLHPIKFSNGQLSSTYLRPSTLFGPKMEEYLQSAVHACQVEQPKVVSEKVDRSKLLDITF